MKPVGRNLGHLSCEAIAIMALGLTVVAKWNQVDPDNSIWINSDTFYLPALLSDLMTKPAWLWQWTLTPAPYYFPDMAIFFPLWLGLPLQPAFLAYAWIQIGVCGALLRRIFCRVGLGAHRSLAWGLLLAWVLSAVPTLHGPPNVARYSLVPTYHFGQVLAMLYVWASVLDSQGLSRRAAIVSVLTLASDYTFACTLLAPLATLRLAGWLPQLTWRRLGQITVAGSVLSLLRRSDPHHMRPDFAAIGDHLGAYVEMLARLGAEQPSLFVATLLTIATGIVTWQRPSILATKTRLSIIFFAAAVAWVIAAAILHMGIFDRYLLWPCFAMFLVAGIGIAAALERMPRQLGQAARYSLLGTVVAVALAEALPPAIHRPWWPQWSEPRWAGCAREFARQNPSITGVAEYWNAKKFAVIAGSGLRVLELTPQGKPRRWISSNGWAEQPVRFILLDPTDEGWSKNIGAKVYAEASVARSISCPGASFTIHLLEHDLF